MKLNHSIFATTALALVLGAGGTLLHPAPAFAGKAAKAGKAAGKEAKKDQRVIGSLTPDMLEKVLGKPLTPEQEAGVDDAQKTFVASVAKTVGLSQEELVAKIKEYRTEHRGKGKTAAVAPAAAAPAAKP